MFKRKNMILAAVIGAFAGGAFAAENVVVYGKVDASVEAAKVSGSQSSRAVVNSNDSYIGFKGAEDLGNGLKAIFQIEAGVALDGGQADSVGGSSTLFGTRDSFVGLKSNQLGTLKLGHMVSPYHELSVAADPFYGRTASIHSVIGTVGNGANLAAVTGLSSTAGDASFNRFHGNTIQYESPLFQGFSGKFAYSSNEGKNDLTGFAPVAYSMAVGYDSGVWSVGYGYEQHNDYFGLSQMGGAVPGASQNTKDKAHKVVGGINFQNGLKVAALYERLSFDRDASAVVGDISSYDRDAFGFTGSYTMGANTLNAGVVKARAGDCSSFNGAACSTSGLGATAYSLGVTHAMSKRTEVYANYTRINNKANSNYVTLSNSFGSAAGGDFSGLGVGMKHSF